MCLGAAFAGDRSFFSIRLSARFPLTVLGDVHGRFLTKAYLPWNLFLLFPCWIPYTFSSTAPSTVPQRDKEYCVALWPIGKKF